MTTWMSDGRELTDHAGVVARTGMSGRTVDEWIAASPDNGFPQRLPGTRHFDVAAVDSWWAAEQQRQRANLTTVSRHGDPDELVGPAEIARIAGYQDTRSLHNSSLWRTLVPLNRPEHNVELPTRVRLQFPRRVVWEALYDRPGRGGRPGRTVSREVDRTGSADDILSATQASQILGYPSLTALTDSAEWPLLLRHAVTTNGGGPGRQFRRSTVWDVADTRPPATAAHVADRPAQPRTVDRSGDADELVGAAEAARVLGYPRAQSLPQDLLDLADERTQLGADRSATS